MQLGNVPEKEVAILLERKVDGLLGHSATHTIQELRTVKNDTQSLKVDLATQIITNGGYDLPTSKHMSYTKLIIDSLMTFINT